MTKYQIQINPDSIQRVLDFSGISAADASLEIGASEKYLKRSMESGQMSQKYFSAFCETFNVAPATIQSKRKPKEVQPISRNSADKVNFNGSYCRSLIYEKGLAPLNNLSLSLGASDGYLATALRDDFIDLRILDDLAQKLGVTTKELMDGKPPQDTENSGRAIKIDPEKVKEIIKNAGLNMDQAAFKLGYSHSVIDKVIRKGQMSQDCLSRFCREFGVEESDIRLNPDKTTEVQINTDLCRELIYKNGYTLNSASTTIGYSQSSLSAALATGAMTVSKLKALAGILNVNWKSLLKDGEQACEEPKAIRNEDIPMTYYRALHGFAGRMKEAWGCLEADLSVLEGEDADGQT